MKIIELRILPPIAIGRLGSSTTPMEAYNLTINQEKPLDFRNIVPELSFEVDEHSGEIVRAYKPSSVQFKDGQSTQDKRSIIRPVSPFLEVFAITDQAPDELVPLTTDLLTATGHKLEDISWSVDVANIKIFRRTQDSNDKITATLHDIRNHVKHSLNGLSDHFLANKNLPLGYVQFIKPTTDYPQIRLRYTPGPGKVYGASRTRIEQENAAPVADPIITHDDLVLYDKAKGCWLGYTELNTGNPIYTNPAQIFAGYDAEQGRVSWGYLDDECDGFAAVTLTNKDGSKLTAKAHISAGPPAFAPDTLPVRVVSDELEQILLGPDIDDPVPFEEAKEIVRRAFETVRLMNTAVMNGNTIKGRDNIASTMVRQDANDFNRFYEPIMATTIVDNLALRALHDQVFNGLSTGAAAWFSQALRRPDKIGDLSNEERRKMPALMRGADGRALCLTHRQINTIIKAGLSSLFDERCDTVASDGNIAKDDLVSQLMYRGNGNPYAVLSRTAISNCFPGLEFDFRNLWRRALKEILLIENNNYVLEGSKGFEHLKGHRLVAIDYKPTMVSTSGPVYPNGGNISLKTAANPNAVSFMEWSNNLATLLQKQGETVVCHFTKIPSEVEVVVTAEELNNGQYKELNLTVNQFFANQSAALSDDIIQPGELTQGLCAPWQNDYRECACYYWAASRPDFVNVVPDEQGLSAGDNWMAKERSGEYILDDRTDDRLVSYDDLFKNWEGELDFIVKGFDATHSADEPEQ